MQQEPQQLHSPRLEMFFPSKQQTRWSPKSGFHGLILITMLVSNEFGDSKSLVDPFQAVKLFPSSHYNSGFVVSLSLSFLYYNCLAV